MGDSVRRSRDSGPAPSPRIGDAERAEAQRALQQHLGAGRLRVDEFVERFRGAAEALTAAEAAALFADLPAPHPRLPRSPAAGTRRGLVVAGALALLLLAGVVGFAVGRGRPAPAPPVAVAAPAPDAAPPFGPLTSPAGPPANDPDALADSATVRWTTGPGLITLRPSYGIDLDNMTWHVDTGCCDRDVGYAADASRLSIDQGHAVVTGPLEFATCLRETGYTTAPIERGALRPGDTICVRTSGHRLALVTVVEAGQDAVEFGATVWDPPVPW